MTTDRLDDHGVEILIVEDSRTQAARLKFTLELHNFTVSVAYNGIEALALIGARKPTMVISDVVMSEMDGYQLCKEIKSNEESRDLPVILLTALSDPWDVVRALECGADNFITKPYEEKNLLWRVQYMLANQNLNIENSQLGVEIFLAGKRYHITSGRLQILNLLLSSYEVAIQKNEELAKARNQLASINNLLEEKVKERTSELSEAIKGCQRAEDRIRLLNAELEQRIEQRTAQLEAANRELECFAYSVSHDLRAPLRAMNGFSRALVEDFGDRLEEEARDYLNEIVLGSQHMGRLIDGLLTLSRSTNGELRNDPIDLSEMAQRIRCELEKTAPERRVGWQIEPGLSAWGDAGMIEVVMRNLLGNAWKYTAGKAEPMIRIHAEGAGNERLFCVTDNGAGFDMAHADKLFQPFQRLHRQDEFPGLGVGLATARRIVHRHGGTIHAVGAPHQGATFSFSLPFAEEERSEEAQQLPCPGGGHPPGGKAGPMAATSGAQDG